MIEKVFSNPEIYKIHVPLPDNPLQNLNCYVIKTEEENLIIDTGFNRPECYEALMKGLEALSIDMNKTSLFLTHLHSDHIGLTPKIMPPSAKIYMGKTDYIYLGKSGRQYWELTEAAYIKEGFPEQEIIALRTKNPARSFAPDSSFDAILLQDGDTFSIGPWEFTAVYTPGHSPGHMCLYLAEKKIIFLGDHVLFNITPNITAWFGVPDSLDNYLKSLEKISRIPILLALPAHRKNEMDVYERIEQIKHHHKIRLKNILDILAKQDGLTAYETGAKMKWSMRGKDWTEFPLSQKWFAVGETMSHLDYLCIREKIKKIEANGLYRYYYVEE